MTDSLCGYRVYPNQTNNEFVLFDPVSLQSVFLSKDEYNALTGSGHQMHSEVVSQVELLGFSISEPTDTLPERLNEQLVRIGLTGIPERIVGYRIVATDKCNLHCKYCFVDTNTGRPDMTEEDLLYGLDFLLQQNKGAKEVGVQWFGGEPTIRFDLMRIGDIFLRDNKDKYGIKKVQSTVVTNGVRLTDEMLEHFNEFRYGVGVSFDGMPEVNRQNRYMLNGKPADDRVLDSISRLKLLPQIALGVNMTPSDANVDRMPEIVDYIMDELGVKFIYVNSPIPYEGKWFVDGSKLALNLFKARARALSKGGQFYSLIERVYQSLDSRRPKVFEHIQTQTNGLIAALLPRRRLSLCEVNFKDASFIVDIDAVKNDRSLLGKIRKELLPFERCGECPAIAICGGPSRNELLGQSHREPNPNHCAFYERAVELSLWDNSSLQ